MTIGVDVPPCTWMTNTVYLIYEDMVALSADATHHVHWLPIDSVDLAVVNPAPIYAGELVAFSADLLPDDAYKPYSYTIDFGDGMTASGSSSDDPLSFTHTYTEVATYTVEIAVWNLGNVEPVTDTVEVVVATPLYRLYLPVIAKSF